MERFKIIVGSWWADLSGLLASSLCWFTKSHCEYLTTLLALIIGLLTLFFITIPKVIPNVRKSFNGIKGFFNKAV